MKLTQEVSLRVIALFSVAILSTFIGDYGRSFFGDWYCDGSGERILIKATQTTYEHYDYAGCQYIDGHHSAQWHWGYRHWLYATMCLTLFIIQVVEIINHVESKSK